MRDPWTIFDPESNEPLGVLIDAELAMAVKKNGLATIQIPEEFNLTSIWPSGRLTPFLRFDLEFAQGVVINEIPNVIFCTRGVKDLRHALSSENGRWWLSNTIIPIDETSE